MCGAQRSGSTRSSNGCTRAAGEREPTSRINTQVDGCYRAGGLPGLAWRGLKANGLVGAVCHTQVPTHSLGSTRPASSCMHPHTTQPPRRQRMAEGGLDMPAPILATAYQSLSRGLEAFEGCR